MVFQHNEIRTPNEIILIIYANVFSTQYIILDSFQEIINDHIAIIIVYEV